MVTDHGARIIDLSGSETSGKKCEGKAKPYMKVAGSYIYSPDDTLSWVIS